MEAAPADKLLDLVRTALRQSSGQGLELCGRGRDRWADELLHARSSYPLKSCFAHGRAYKKGSADQLSAITCDTALALLRLRWSYLKVLPDRD
jgi:hypothetical protein